MKREVEGATKLRTFFAGALNALPYPPFGMPEAVIYPLVAVKAPEVVRELRELVYLPARTRDKSYPEAPALLESMYDECKSAHVVKDDSIVLGTEYEWYLRKDEERLLNDPLPQLFSRAPYLDIYGERLKNPDRIFDKVSASKLVTKVCPVHGDLHPNNVLYGPRFTPVLIDYAFGHLNGHFIKDFVLMECSLRFLLPPPLLEPNLISRFDDLLLAEDGWERRSELDASGRTLEVLSEMAALVGVIRRQCRARYPAYDFTEYLLAQYMVLRGALRLLPYQGFRTLRSLCRIADHLEALLYG